MQIIKIGKIYQKSFQPIEFIIIIMMNTCANNPQTHPIIRVAVAVIRYHDEFLLAMRHQHQHQGGKLEFVGGKIEQGESAESALIREVNEEIGLQLQTDQLVRFGVIAHDYTDKSVELHIYQAHLNDIQYQEFRHRTHGCESQALHWLGLDELLVSGERLPAANLRILDWLGLCDTLIISHGLTHFGTLDDFVQYYIDKLPNHACFYLRPQADVMTTRQLYQAICTHRPDIRLMIKDDVYCAYRDEWDADVMVKLSAQTLANMTHRITQGMDISADLPSDFPIMVGVHDANEVMMANLLARHARIIAAMVSPVLPTQSHPTAPVLGWQHFSELAGQLSMPAIALGGLNPSDAVTAKAYGAVAISGIRGML